MFETYSEITVRRKSTKP